MGAEWLTSNRQLIYQPFTPYFVLFANIISDPDSAECFKDLQLLRKVVLYFLQMHNNHQSAKRLEKVAETFTRLAEAYVRQSMQSRQQVSSRSDDKLNSRRRPKDPAACFTTAAPSLTDPGLSEFTNAPKGCPSATDVLDQTQSMLGDLDSDPMALLNFFSPSNSYAGFTTSCMASNTGWLTEVENFEQAQQQQFPTVNTDWAPIQLIRGIENIAQNYGLDGTFDWLSWDQYDSSTT